METFDWEEFLELAKALAGQSTGRYSVEALYRSAVSRAYYAAFCFARNDAETRLGFQRIKKAEDHQLLIEWLRQKGRIRMASNLKKLREWRNYCDYEDRIMNLDVMVRIAIRIADQVILECKRK